ncbi:MAG: hypothetical protein ACXVES_07505 [Actinomycetota bacterium]
MTPEAEEPRESPLGRLWEAAEAAAGVGYGAYWIFRFIDRWTHQPAVALFIAIAIPGGLIVWGWRATKEAQRLSIAAGLPDSNPALDRALSHCLMAGAISTLIVALMLPLVDFTWRGVGALARSLLVAGIAVGLLGFTIAVRLFFRLLRNAAGEG